MSADSKVCVCVPLIAAWLAGIRKLVTVVFKWSRMYYLSLCGQVLLAGMETLYCVELEV